MKRDALPVEITYGSVCSGIEAATVAWAPMGWRAAWLGEIEPFPARVLHHHYGSGRPLHMPDPDEANDQLTTDDRNARRVAIKAVSMLPLIEAGPRNLGDMTKIAAMVRADLVAAPDVLVGGTPCQAFSIAGLRGSLDDARGQLTLSFVNLANEIDTARHVRGDDECVIVWENVPGVLSTKDNAFGCFLGALAGEDSPLLPPGGKWPNAGCVYGPQRRIAWRVLDAQYFGVAQRRRRVFIVASARKGFDPTAVLFEFDGVRRDTPPSREAWQDAAAGTLRGTDGGSDVDHARAGHLHPVDVTEGGQLARCLTTKTRIDAETETLIPTIGGGFVDTTATLDASYGRLQGASGQDANHGHSHLVPLSVSLQGREGGATAELGDDVAPCLRTGGGGGDKAHVLAPVVAAPVQRAVERPRGDGIDTLIAFSVKDYGGDAMVNCAPTLRAGNHSTSHANGGQPPAIAFNAVDYKEGTFEEVDAAGALTTSADRSRAAPLVVAFAENSRGELRLEGGDGQRTGALSTGGGKPGQGMPVICVTGEVTHTLKAEGFDASEDGTGRGQPIVASLMETPWDNQEKRIHDVRRGATPTLSARCSGGGTVDGWYTAPGMAVRRLTPRECERLQSFPDFYTLVPLSKVKASRAETMLVRGEPVIEIDGQWWKLSADGPRYKALGNSMCVFNMRWIGRRVHFALTGEWPACANFTHEREMGLVAA